MSKPDDFDFNTLSPLGLNRLIAVELANQTSYLTDGKYYDRVIAAIAGRDGNAFKVICDEAGIHPQMRPVIWKALLGAAGGPGAGWLPL